ncbi:MAG: isocitrate dehydrogenase [NADP] [Candidatus Micrarchaeota archaeon]|nr:MAG: isocitrate dehydrogenase [NADP] [Candidatus Micrarchaeota archaeon]
MNFKILYAEGDGIGKDIVPPTVEIIKEAVKRVEDASIEFERIELGLEALDKYGDRFPRQAQDMLMSYRYLLKGPIETPVGEGERSVNVRIRLLLDLYANIRPVRYESYMQSPLKDPNGVDLVIIRENTDDIYRGIEWPYDSDEASRLRSIMKDQFNIDISSDSGVGIKSISRRATERIARFAIEYALKNNRRSITIMHKGNIMKYTEGFFREVVYNLYKREYADKIYLENEQPQDSSRRILINDRIADNMLQQIIINPRSYDIILAPNLNGDYVSDAAGALIGNIALLGSANIGDDAAMFEAVHGTAPKYAGQHLANPTGIINAGVMMLEHLGLSNAALLIRRALAEMYNRKIVTRDVARYMNVNPVSTDEFCSSIIDYIKDSGNDAR